MDAGPTRRRGPKPRPTDHPVGLHLRRQREARGWSVRRLAAEVGLGPGSASLISQLEGGRRVPTQALARRLASALGDRPEIYLAWARIGRRNEALATAGAVATLGALLDDPRLRVGAVPRPPGFVRAIAAAGAEPGPRVIVVEIREGADPADPQVEVIARHRLASAAAAAAGDLSRPFAWRLTASGVRRVGDVLRPGDLAILSRAQIPPVPLKVHAVRAAEGIVLAHVLWNGRQLALLPAEGESDFVVLDAPDARALERLLVARVAAVLR